MDVTSLLEPSTLSGYQYPRTLFPYIHRGQLRDGRTVAIKTFSWLSTSEKMIAIWARCTHPNIVQLIGKASFQRELSGVYEWHEYGSIRQYLNHHPEADYYDLSAQIGEGVAYLHANDIVSANQSLFRELQSHQTPSQQIHGTLKGVSWAMGIIRNQILVSSNGVPRIQLSVVESTHTQDAVFQSWYGPWSAPEFDGRFKCTFAGDVYALGMETITRDRPYGAETKLFEVMKKVRQREPPARPKEIILVNGAGNVVWDILCKCWSYKPDDRPSAGYVCDVMRTVHQTPDGLAFRVPVPKLVVTEGTSIQDLATHFAERGLIDYADILHPATIVSTVLVADTALANVYRVESLYHEPVALKCVKHTTLYKQLKRAARELACWSSHEHENILPLYGFTVLGDELAMVSPWMKNGHVTEYVAKYPYCNRLALCKQLGQAIAYLHANNVVHGDVKGPNVLISDAGVVQVSDFGVSIADHQEIEFSLTSAGGGTQRWQAPEILLGPSDDPQNRNGSRDGDSSKEGDVYALGMTMIEIYTGDRPYGAMDWSGRMFQGILSGRLRPSRPTRLPIDATGKAIWQLMEQCWAGNPQDRPTSGEVYNQLTSL